MRNLVTGIWQFYVEGFRSMTLGRTLWLIIAIKLFIMFFILRLFFFPNYLNKAAVGSDNIFEKRARCLWHQRPK